MKFEDISGLSQQELNKKEKDLSKQLFEAKMKNALGQLPNPMVIRGIRRDVARVKTALRMRLAETIKKAGVRSTSAAEGLKK